MPVPRKKRQRPAPEHLVTTAPTQGRCGQCRAHVLTGLSWGERVKYDPTHINLRGEAMALVLGDQTYEVYGKTPRPVERRVRHIRDGIPCWGFLLARHRCGVCYDHPEYRDERGLYAIPRECPF